MTTTVAKLELNDGTAQTPSSPKRRLPILDTMLREQRDLSAVERFSQQHSTAPEPLLSRYYRDLLPATPPGPGQQYAFEVDLERCTGCKACVTACHRLNGLDAGETWRSVGLLHGGTPEQPVQKTVTTACHHCLDPACLQGCPVNAYEKDPDTGIVRHLDDQCIGCQYCIFTCPYEVPQFNRDKGIVRKCDMCSDRLATGEAPACVQACPNQAISIRIVDQADVRRDAQSDAFLPGAPSPGITFPTTSYRQTEALPRNVLPADFFAVRPARQHMPLVFMLVLTQLAAGAFCFERLARYALPLAPVGPARAVHALLALLLALLALTAAMAHLGRPRYAYRALLGLRTSWLSREIAAFGAFTAFGTGYAAFMLAEASGVSPPVVAPAALGPALGHAAALSGALGVFCSIMVYAVTRRRFWSLHRTASRFVGTALVLGLVTAQLSLFVALQTSPELEQAVFRTARLVAHLLVAATVGKLLVEASVLRHLTDRQYTDLRRTAVLLTRELGRLGLVRFGLALTGGVALPLAFMTDVEPGGGAVALAAAALALLLLTAGEILERMTYFAALSSPRMPGALS